ncbi:NPCBM/NEW2 domain-containing protein [Streptomyces spongiae]|uniref:NPCBM/NEW2 domain-containing protein n=1 Tax=Streptomyces spongiae TaxID=565072 RepID=UPI0018833968|nr:NPCBM/NEW2 domain-containing protein [Streptomyces spongiae]
MKRRTFTAITAMSIAGFCLPTAPIAVAATVNQGSQEQYLSEIDPLRSEYGVENESAEIDGEQYSQSVAMRADKSYVPYGDAEYNLGRKWRSFDATIGLRDDSPSESVLKFEVFGDGKVLYEEQMEIGESSEIDLNVSGKLRLTLKVSYQSSEDIDSYCYGVWGDARLSTP